MIEDRPKPTAAIVVRNLIRIYRDDAGAVAALRGVDLDVAEGEMVGVVGASGSGKSTLLRILAGLDAPSAGSVVVFGQRLERASESDRSRYRLADIAFVQQHYWRSLSPHLTVRESIELPLRLRGWSRTSRAARTGELLERVGLHDRGAARPRELSGGEQQRVAFAAALASRPRLLLADEPTGELDERAAEEILELLRTLVREEGATAVVVTHDPSVERLMDRTAYFRDGRAIAFREGGPNAPLMTSVDGTGWTAPLLPPPSPAIPPILPALGTAAAVTLRGVSRRYGEGGAAIDAISDLSADLAAGGLHIVTGPSGSGKSTLLRLIAGLDRPTQGSIRTLGIDLDSLDRDRLAQFRAQHVAVCPQAPRLTAFMTVLENVELVLSVRGWNADEQAVRGRARRALADVGLHGLEGALPESLSGGERARVSIARALASDPEIIILDEPTATLDRSSADSLISLLGNLDRDRVTVIAATHDRELIGVASDRLDLREAQRTTAS